MPDGSVAGTNREPMWLAYVPLRSGGMMRYSENGLDSDGAKDRSQDTAFE